MMPGELAPMIVMVTLILTAGGVAILRPISKQLAQLLQVMTQERISAAARPQAEVGGLREQLSAMESRLSQLEERQGFTEALLETPAGAANGARAVAAPSAQPAARGLPTP